MRRSIPLLLFVLALSAAGDKYPVGTFRSPLGIPLFLSGSFGEMRTNHFHTGLDIRTQGQTGFKIYAVADGWVERIAVSPTGYGNALYVNHDNGYQSVYGHLEQFEDSLLDYVRSAQYARRSFAVDLAPERNRFRFAKGDVIAYSGNSGSSGGAHLHFEIRDAATSQPINPILFGMPVTDTTPPRIHVIRAYPLSPDARVEVLGAGGRVRSRAAFGASAEIPVVAGAGHRYAIAPSTTVRAFGRVGFGISTNDYHEGSSGRLGAYEVRLEVDGTPVYRHEMERLDFAFNRYLNAHVDYGLQQRSGSWVQRSFLLPGNDRLQIYETVAKGAVEFGEDDRRTMLYTVEDAAGNGVSLSFPVSGMSAAAPVSPSEGTIPVTWNRDTLIEREGIAIRIPPGALYDDLKLDYSVVKGRSDAYSNVHVVHDPSVPIQSPIRIALDAARLPERLRPFAAIARLGTRGVSYEGGRYEDSVVTTETRSFGSFFITADTTAPSIRPVNVSNGASLAGASAMRFRISDNFSGIAGYEGYVDGEWVLFGYDAKTATLEHVFDGRVTRGRHELEVRVTDNVGNVARWRGAFTR